MKRNLRPRTSAFVALAAFALSASCSTVEMSEGDDGGAVGGSGGAAGASGSTANGGTNSGGTTSIGGATSGAGGNVAGTGGTPGTGGVPGTGGAPTTGGVPGTGGTPANGGAGLGGTDGGSGLGGTGAGIGGAGGAPIGGTGGAGQGGAGAGGTAGKGGAGAGGTAGKGGAGASGAAGKGGSGGSGTTGTAPSSGCGKAPTVTSGRTTIDVNGKMREYIVLVPSNYDQNKPYRLIFGWHPWGGSAQQTQQMGYFGLSTPSGGQAVLVAPEGQDFQDGGLGWGNANGEDVAFAHAMMDRFFAGLCIDQNRVFSTGFSFGAMFSFTLACTANSGMRAIAPMAGNSTTSGRCENGTRSVATMAFVGTNDSLLSVHRSAVQIFVGRNGCTTTKTPVTPSWCDGLASQYLPCSCVQYQGCKDGYPVVECEYTAGHQFAPSSGQTLWNFFSQF